MSPLASLLPLLWLFTPAPLLTADALRVVTDEPALGEEIARAARRYVRGPIEIDRRGDPGGSRSEGAVPPASRHGAPEGTAEPTAVLRVQRSQADAKAERWELLLSLGWEAGAVARGWPGLGPTGEFAPRPRYAAPPRAAPAYPAGQSRRLLPDRSGSLWPAA